MRSLRKPRRHVNGILKLPNNVSENILGENIMSDLKEYINNRKNIDSKFSENFEVGYENLKIGVLLKQMREKSGYTRE